MSAQALKDLRASEGNFDAFLAYRIGTMQERHTGSLRSWIKSRVKRLDPRGGKKEKAALGAVGLTGKGLAPAKVAYSAERVGDVLQGTATLSLVPLASTIITIGTFAYGKHKGRATNEAMTRKYGLDSKIRTEQEMVNIIENMTLEECCRFIGWFANDGLVQMTDAMGKLVEATRQLNKALDTYNGTTNRSNYVDLVDKWLYFKHRELRANFYVDMLSAVARRYKKAFVDAIAQESPDGPQATAALESRLSQDCLLFHDPGSEQ